MGEVREVSLARERHWYRILYVVPVMHDENLINYRPNQPADEDLDEPVIGWSIMCSCGWRTRNVYDRVRWPAPTNAPTAEVASGLNEIWLAHAAPLIRVEEAGAELEAAKRKLDLAVVEAKSNGITWREIGDVLGMTRQAAHEKWRRLTDRARRGA